MIVELGPQSVFHADRQPTCPPCTPASLHTTLHHEFFELCKLNRRSPFQAMPLQRTPLRWIQFFSNWLLGIAQPLNNAVAKRALALQMVWAAHRPVFQLQAAVMEYFPPHGPLDAGLGADIGHFLLPEALDVGWEVDTWSRLANAGLNGVVAPSSICCPSLLQFLLITFEKFIAECPYATTTKLPPHSCNVVLVSKQRPPEVQKGRGRTRLLQSFPAAVLTTVGPHHRITSRGFGFVFLPQTQTSNDHHRHHE